MSCDSSEDIQQRTAQALATLEEKYPPLSTCGNWIEELDGKYSQEKDNLPRLIFVPHVSGLADRFVGIATVFLLSLITNRLFFLGNMPELHPLDSPFQLRFPHIAASVPPHFIPFLRENKTHPGASFYLESSSQSLIINAIGDGDILLMNETIDMIRSSNMTDIYVVTNRGRTISMFDKPNLKKTLSKMGLTKSTAFGCSLRYHFQPRADIFVPLLPSLEALMLPSTMKIAIHIRTHDGVLVYGNRIVFDHYLPYFKCAEQIESFANQKSQKFIWIFYTDSVELRGMVLDKFGADKVRVAMDVPVEHSAKEMVCPLQTCVTKSGFNIAAAEWWSLGLADYFVVGIQGGYGKSGVMRTGRLNSTYLIYPEMPQKVCTRKNYARTNEIKLAYAGI